MALREETWAEDLKCRLINAKTEEEELQLLIKASVTTDYKRIGIVVNLAIEYQFFDEIETLFSHRLRWGSSPEHKSLEYLHCANANNSRIKSACPKRGSLHCCGCYLVAYCSKDCQKEHWAQHKKQCKSEFVSPNWMPGWILQERLSTIFTGDDVVPAENVFKDYIWGNTPAYDLMRWGFNETKIDNDVYCKAISMAFLTGDFRNIVETLAGVPENVNSPLYIVLNDANPVVTARNLLMLLALQAHGADAIDAVLQVWYSTRLTIEQYCLLSTLVHSAATKSLSTSEEPLVFANSERKAFSINLYQATPVLSTLCQMVMKNSSDLDAVSNERLKVLFDPRQIDQRDSFILHLKPHQRVAWNYFRNDGLFLPLSAHNINFQMPNKFIMNPNSAAWPIADCSDPTDEWDMRLVDKFTKSNKLPVNDFMGCLYFYVRERLLKAVATLERLPVKIDLYCNDARILVETLSARVDEKFDRIDASNLADEGCLGLSRLLPDLVPLLNVKNENSILVTLFMNWFQAIDDDFCEVKEELKNQCFPVNMIEGFPKLIEVCAATDDSGKFEQFLITKMRNLKNLAVARRQKHTVVPHRLFAPIEAPSNFTFRELSDEESYFVMGGVAKCTLRERYAEWVLK